MNVNESPVQVPFKQSVTKMTARKDFFFFVVTEMGKNTFVIIQLLNFNTKCANKGNGRVVKCSTLCWLF